ncbi:MAG TPA: gamma-glutamyl-gamma-aminobutyrate hydrolase family protein [Candidatus Cybelea sp.]|nr:gamma-glutamyl-gamma-aminobutyrate hydrolase family protein [Candidatus Cybelea sp.]
MPNEAADKPRIGIPYRTRKEELTSDHHAYDLYVRAVRDAGGEPVAISLDPAEDHAVVARRLDAFLLPGSPADVDPARYGSPRHPQCSIADPLRERADWALLESAFADGKPVLAICYGIQSLNVFLGGSLIQDIPSELGTAIRHNWTGRQLGAPEPLHEARLEPGTRLIELAGTSELRVNSSHHQSILRPGRGLNVVGRAADGVVEAVEWTGDQNWVMGVQWHPERMVGRDGIARSLFAALARAAGRATAQPRA